MCSCRAAFSIQATFAPAQLPIKVYAFKECHKSFPSRLRGDDKLGEYQNISKARIRNIMPVGSKTECSLTYNTPPYTRTDVTSAALA